MKVEEHVFRDSGWQKVGDAINRSKQKPIRARAKKAALKPKADRRKTKTEEQATSPIEEQATASKKEAPQEVYTAQIKIFTGSVLDPSYWLPVTSKKTGFKVFVPLPIRLIQQIPEEQGGGCMVRGAHGDESTTKENILQILDMLNAHPLGSGAGFWQLAG